MNPNFIIIFCALACLFLAKTNARKAQLKADKDGMDLQKMCWAMSRQLLLIIASGFIAGYFCRGRVALFAFLLSIAATGVGQLLGMDEAKKKKSK